MPTTGVARCARPSCKSLETEHVGVGLRGVQQRERLADHLQHHGDGAVRPVEDHPDLAAVLPDLEPQDLQGAERTRQPGLGPRRRRAVQRRAAVRAAAVLAVTRHPQRPVRDQGRADIGDAPPVDPDEPDRGDQQTGDQQRPPRTVAGADRAEEEHPERQRDDQEERLRDGPAQDDARVPPLTEHHSYLAHCVRPS